MDSFSTAEEVREMRDRMAELVAGFDGPNSAVFSTKDHVRYPLRLGQSRSLPLLRSFPSSLHDDGTRHAWQVAAIAPSWKATNFVRLLLPFHLPLHRPPYKAPSRAPPSPFHSFALELTTAAAIRHSSAVILDADCRQNMIGSPPRGVPVVVDYR